MTTALEIYRDKADQFAAVAAECSAEALAQLRPLEQGLQMARGISLLMSLVDDDMAAELSALQGLQLGFKTDKVYDLDTVRRCFVEATVWGVRPIGNEFNILAGNCYITKNGLRHILLHYPGLTHLDILPGVPVMKNGGAVVSMCGRWKLHGQADELAQEIPVRVNSGQGVDAILGKAERKLYAAIHKRLTGAEHELPNADTDEVDMPDAAAKRVRYSTLFHDKK